MALGQSEPEQQPQPPPREPGQTRSQWLDSPQAPKIAWSVILVVVGILGWAGKVLVDSIRTTWDTGERIEAIKADVLKKANDSATTKLAGYLTREDWIRWQLQFEQQERARDRDKLEDLKSLLRAQGRR